MTDFHFNVHMDGKITFEIHYEEGALLEVFPEARTGKFDLVLTKTISRFGRNTEEAIQALRELNEAQVAVQFDEENINSSEAGSEFIISILSAYAEGG